MRKVLIQIPTQTALADGTGGADPKTTLAGTELSQSVAGEQLARSIAAEASSQSLAASNLAQSVAQRPKIYPLEKFETMSDRLPPGSPSPQRVVGLFNDRVGSIRATPTRSLSAQSKIRFLHTSGALAFQTAATSFTLRVNPAFGTHVAFANRMVAQAEHGFFGVGNSADRWGFTRYGNGNIFGTLTDSYTVQAGGTWPAGQYTFIFVVVGGSGEILRWHVGTQQTIAANSRVTLNFTGWQIADDLRVDCFAYLTDPTTAWYLGQMTKPTTSLLVEGLPGPAQRLHRMDDTWIDNTGTSILQATAYYNGRFFYGGQTFSLSGGRGAVNLRWSDPFVNYTYGQDDNYLKVGDDQITFLASTTNGLYIFTPYKVYLATGSFSPLLDDTRVELLPIAIGADNNQGDVDGDTVYVIFKGKVWRVRGGEEEEISAPLLATFTGLIIDKATRTLYAFSSTAPASVYAFDLQTNKWSIALGDSVTHAHAFYRGAESSPPQFFNLNNNYVLSASSFLPIEVVYSELDFGMPFIRKAFDRILFRTKNAASVSVTASIDGAAVAVATTALPGGYYETRITTANRVGYNLSFHITVNSSGSIPALLFSPIEIHYTPREAVR